MARNYYKRRFLKKSYKKTLKKSNIFGNKTPKGQARQIYALNKKINYIQKRNAPEIIKKINNMVSFSADTVAGIHRIDLYKDRLFDEDFSNYRMQTDVIRPHSIKFSGVVGLCPSKLKIKAESTSQNSSDYTYYPEQPNVVYYRILIGYVRSGGQPISNPIVNLTPQGAPIGFTSMSVINGPLVEHFSQNCMLVKQKILKVDKYHPSKSFVIKLKGKKLMNYQRSTGNIAGDDNLGKGELIMWIQTLSPTWLQGNYVVEPDGKVPEYYCNIDYNMSFVDNM